MADLLDRRFARTLDTPINIPNLLSTAGLASAIAWLLGGGPWWAVASIVLDEMDGTVARMTGQTSAFGAEYDSAIDMCLQGAVAVKVGCPWLLLVTVPLSVHQKIQGGKPAFGSWRAIGMMAGMALNKNARVPQ